MYAPDFIDHEAILKPAPADAQPFTVEIACKPATGETPAEQAARVYREVTLAAASRLGDVATSERQFGPNVHNLAGRLYGPRR